MNYTPENAPQSNELSRRRKRVALYIAALVVAVSLGLGGYLKDHQPSGSTSAQDSQVDKFLQQTENSLTALHQESHGGWRFRSQIQAPHFQTDRDVGAASVGMGFLAAGNIKAAENTANWLIAVSKQNQNGGRYWPDYVDEGSASPNVYTSFDDGTLGIGDFFWQLYEKTGNPRYKQTSLDALHWTFSQAEPYSQDGLRAYRWKWDVTDSSSPYYMGMGEGTVGTVYALATYYQRLQHSDPKIAAECKKYMEGGLNYIDIVRQNLAKNIGSGRTIPETGAIGQNGDTALNSGYLSGAAGAAFMYLKLHEVFGQKTYLDKSKELLGWLSDSANGPLVKVANNQATWRIELDPQDTNNNQYATGVEEGAAGIGWTFLQAYGQTGNKSYLATAEAAGNWLLAVAIKDRNGGLYWHEDEHPASKSAPHANLNNGAAGIGMFLYDLSLATKDQTSQKKYRDGANGALKWLMNTAHHQGNNIYWLDNSGNTYQNDPSWHWGDAGVIEFIQRINGGKQDIIGEQPALNSDLLSG